MAAEEAVRAAMYVPRHFPPVTAAAHGDDGSLWLQREEVPDADREWWVLDREGELVASVTLPARFRLKLIRADVLWGVEWDDLDVPYVVGYRIRRSHGR
ncbi:MAG TPA: hypothetical protein VMN39_10295, partial [Longimicrobiaceae bacterium]|nr:hypothetical protein [Longimicrobiaceae bacterium]